MLARKQAPAVLTVVIQNLLVQGGSVLRKSLGLICMGVLLCAGCARKSARYASKVSVDEARSEDRVSGLVGYARLEPALTRIRNSTSAGFGGEPVFAASRFVAVRHKLEIIEPASALPKSLEAVVAYCSSIQCEVLSSNISGTAADSTPSGSVSMRVLPQDLNKLLDFAGKQGKIAQHSTETEDKTAAVIDVEAKIKNQTEFRDSLRRMLVKPGVNVANLLQIQEKLAEAQSELDAEATLRKNLANETEKVAIEIAFRSEIHSAKRGAFASVTEAFSEFGSNFGDSLAALIEAIAAIIPWLIVIVPGIWLLKRFVSRIRRNRAAAKLEAQKP